MAGSPVRPVLLQVVPVTALMRRGAPVESPTLRDLWRILPATSGERRERVLTVIRARLDRLWTPRD